MQNEIFHVIIGPTGRIADEIQPRLASIIGKNLYETGLLLTGRIPKIVFHTDNLELAKSKANMLTDLGFVSFVLSDSNIRKSSQILRAHSAKIEDGAMVFSSRGNTVVRADFRSIFLVIIGKSETDIKADEVKYKTKINLTQTLLTGIPAIKREKQVTEKKSVESLDFIRFYSKESSDPIVEIAGSDFDYSFLGENMGATATVNFGATIRKLKVLIPDAIFDEKLRDTMLTGQTMISQNADMNCKMIWHYYVGMT